MGKYIHMADLESLELLKTHWLVFNELLELPKEQLLEMWNYCKENAGFVAKWKERNDYGYLCDYRHRFCKDNLRKITDVAAELYFRDVGVDGDV